MPILKYESDIYPQQLLTDESLFRSETRDWWCLYTRSRREKELARKLQAKSIPHYLPVVPKRYRSPNGRLRTSYIPLFANYVFLLGTEEERMEALTTNDISKCHLISEREQFVKDLLQIHGLVLGNEPLTPEARLLPGDPVRVRTGPFRGYEGVVIRREGKTRLLLALHFLQKGVSMQLDEGVLEPL